LISFVFGQLVVVHSAFLLAEGGADSIS